MTDEQERWPDAFPNAKPGTRKARTNWLLHEMHKREPILERVTKFWGGSSTYAIDQAFMDAFDRLEAENALLRSALKEAKADAERLAQALSEEKMRISNMCGCSISFHLDGCDFHGEKDAYLAGPGHHLVGCNAKGCRPSCPVGVLEAHEWAARGLT